MDKTRLPVLSFSLLAAVAVLYIATEDWLVLARRAGTFAVPPVIFKDNGSHGWRFTVHHRGLGVLRLCPYDGSILPARLCPRKRRAGSAGRPRHRRGQVQRRLGELQFHGIPSLTSLRHNLLHQLILYGISIGSYHCIKEFQYEQTNFGAQCRFFPRYFVATLWRSPTAPARTTSRTALGTAEQIPAC